MADAYDKAPVTASWTAAVRFLTVLFVICCCDLTHAQSRFRHPSCGVDFVVPQGWIADIIKPESYEDAVCKVGLRPRNWPAGFTDVNCKPGRDAVYVRVYEGTLETI